MKKLASFAFTAASACLFAASAYANTVVPLSPIPAGSYGDPQLATLEVAKGSAELVLPCSQATFPAIDFNAENGKFSVQGEQASSLPTANPKSTPVTLTGTVSNCEPDGVCRTSAAYITATLSNTETGVVIGHYAFIVGATGVTVHCE